MLIKSSIPRNNKYTHKHQKTILIITSTFVSLKTLEIRKERKNIIISQDNDQSDLGRTLRDEPSPIPFLSNNNNKKEKRRLATMANL